MSWTFEEVARVPDIPTELPERATESERRIQVGKIVQNAPSSPTSERQQWCPEQLDPTSSARKLVSRFVLSVDEVVGVSPMGRRHTRCVELSSSTTREYETWKKSALGDVSHAGPVGCRLRGAPTS